MKKLIVLFALAAVLFGCNKLMPSNDPTIVLDENLYNHDYSVNIKYFLKDNTPTNNQLSNEAAALGRVLFYDTRLSLHNNTSCGSCHKQEDAFADGLQFSTGFNGGLTSRNSMALTNLINSDKLFWDGRTGSLEQLALEPVSHPLEMGFEKIDLLPKKLALTNYYPQLFERAFGSQDISTEKIAQALAQFLRSLTSYTAPVDSTNIPQGGWSFNAPGFTESENNGARLFNNSGCASCHFGGNFGGQTFENIGLELNYQDPGMGTKGSQKEGMFKVPSLRNVELTGPYMHDGRFATLHEVVEHYSESIAPHANLAPILTNATWTNPNDRSPIKFNFSKQEKDDLVAFLKTLTDKKLVIDKKFSDPFVRD